MLMGDRRVTGGRVTGFVIRGNVSGFTGGASYHKTSNTLIGVCRCCPMTYCGGLGGWWPMERRCVYSI